MTCGSTVHFCGCYLRVPVLKSISHVIKNVSKAHVCHTSSGSTRAWPYMQSKYSILNSKVHVSLHCVFCTTGTLSLS